MKKKKQAYVKKRYFNTEADTALDEDYAKLYST